MHHRERSFKSLIYGEEDIGWYFNHSQTSYLNIEGSRFENILGYNAFNDIKIGMTKSLTK